MNVTEIRYRGMNFQRDPGMSVDRFLEIHGVSVEGARPAVTGTEAREGWLYASNGSAPAMVCVA